MLESDLYQPVKAYLEKHINREFSILWEGNRKMENTGIARYFGYTPNYIRTQIDINSNEILTNKIQRTRITSVNPNGENVLSIKI